MSDKLGAQNTSILRHSSADRIAPADNLNRSGPRPRRAAKVAAGAINRHSRGRHSASGPAAAIFSSAVVGATILLGVALTAAGVLPAQAADYETEVLADSPLVYYRLNEAEGPTATNLGLLGSAADGTYSDTTTDVLLGKSSASAGLGTAAKLDFGSIRVPDLGQGPLDQVTIELWLNRQSEPAAGGFFAIWAGDGFSGNTLHYNLKNATAAGPQIEFAIPAGGAHPQFSPMWPTNEWHHLVLTRDGVSSAVRVYLDARLVAEGTKAAAPEFRDGNIGAWGNTRNLDALIDEFAIYPTVLTEDRIAAHFNAAQLTLDPPEIVLQPENATAFPGDRVTLTVTARGQALSFQWLKDNAAIAGATQFSYTMDPVTAADSASYALQVSNSVASVVSRNAVLTVSLAPKPISLLWHFTFDTDTVVNTTELRNAVAGRANGQSRDGAAGFAPAPPTLSTTDAKVGDGALELNGNTFLQLFDDAALNNLPAYTFAAWVKVNSLSGTAAIFSSDSGHPGQTLQLNALAGGEAQAVYDADGDDVLAGPISDGWFHLAFTHDANVGVTNAVLYVNGVAVGNHVADLRGNLALGGTTLGSVGWANSRLNGLLDDARIYDGALTAAEIAALPGGVLATPPLKTVLRFEFTGGIADTTYTEAGGIPGTAAVQADADGAVPVVGGGVISVDGEDTVAPDEGLKVTLPEGIDFATTGFVAEALLRPAAAAQGAGNNAGSQGSVLTIDGGFDLGFAGDNVRTGYYDGGPSYHNVTAKNALSLTEFSHVAAVYSPTTGIELFINGTSQGRAGPGSLASFGAINVVGLLNIDCCGDNRGFHGDVDAVALSTFTGAFDPVRDFALPVPQRVDITSQPRNQTVLEGNPATFRVAVSGQTPAFQWLRNGEAIAGATSDTYTLTAASMTDNGAVFSVRVTNPVNSMTSSDAVLTVIQETSGDYASNVLADSPFVYYRFNETAGPTAANLGSLGAAADGTYAGSGVTLGESGAVSALGPAVGLDGSAGYVAVPDLGIQPLAQVTIELWLKRTVDNAELVALYANDGWEPGALHLNQAGAGPALEFAVNGNGPAPGASYYPRLTPAWPLDEWQAVTVVYDTAAAGQQVTLYLDGALQGTADTGVGDISLAFKAGRIGSWNATRRFTGMVDEFAIYPTALTAAQVLRHYTAAFPHIESTKLGFTTSGNQLTLSWTAAGYKLQQSADLRNPAGWTDVAGGSASPVTVSTGTGNTFYRLLKP